MNEWPQWQTGVYTWAQEPKFPLTKVDVTTASSFVETSSNRNPDMALFPKETTDHLPVS